MVPNPYSYLTPTPPPNPYAYLLSAPTTTTLNARQLAEARARTAARQATDVFGGVPLSVASQSRRLDEPRLRAVVSGYFRDDLKRVPTLQEMNRIMAEYRAGKSLLDIQIEHIASTDEAVGFAQSPQQRAQTLRFLRDSRARAVRLTQNLYGDRATLGQFQRVGELIENGVPESEIPSRLGVGTAARQTAIEAAQRRIGPLPKQYAVRSGTIQSLAQPFVSPHTGIRYSNPITYALAEGIPRTGAEAIGPLGPTMIAGGAGERAIEAAASRLSMGARAALARLRGGTALAPQAAAAAEREALTNVARGKVPTPVVQPSITLPRPPSRPPAAAVPAKEPESIADIVRYLDREIVPIRVGRMGRVKSGTQGIFKVRPEVVRSKRALDIDTISHEIGHALDKQFALTQSSHLSEASRLLRVDVSAYSPEQLPAEHVAEFVRVYLTNPQEARAAAPGFYDEFVSKVGQHPQLATTLEQAQGRIQRWFTQPAEYRILGRVSQTPAKEGTPILERSYRSMVDELRPLQVAVKNITGGKPLPISQDPYRLAWLSRGWAGRAQTWLEHGVTDDAGNVVGPGLKNILAPVRDRLDDFRAYAIARRARELHGRGIPTGVTPEDVDAVLAAKEGATGFRQAFDDLVKFQDAAAQRLVDSGVVSEKAATAMREMNKDYIPLYRVFEGQRGAGMGGRVRAVANLGSPIHRIKGSSREIIDPLESIVKNTYAYLSLAERNNVGRTLVDLASRFEGSGRWIEKIPTPMRPVSVSLKELQGVLQKHGLDIGSLEDIGNIVLTTFRRGGPVPRENILSVWVNGKPQFYQVAPDLYKAMNALNQDSVNALVNILSYPAKLLRAGATLSPDFIPRNPVRDQFMAQIQSEFGYKIGIDFFHGMFHLLRKDDLYWRWLASGGANATMAGVDRAAIRATLSEIVGNRTALQTLGKVILSPVDALRSLSEAFELGTRLGEFRLGVRAAGATPEGVRRAALASREVTLDFARAGDVGRNINRVVAFWNAQVQGLDKIVRTFAANPVQATFRAATAITLPSVLLYFVNRKDPRYQALPRWQKDLFWIVPVGNTLVRIPKPFELGVIFGSLPERVLEWIDTHDPTAFEHFQGTLTQVLFPNIFPTAVLPAIEAMTNFDLFRDQPIVPQSERGLPPAEQYGSYTTGAARLIGRVTGTAPRKVEHIVRGYGGGLGTTALRALSTVTGGGTEDIRPFAQRVPGLQAFTVTPYAQSQDVDDFYSRLERLESYYLANRKRGTPMPPEVVQLPIFRRVSRQLAELRRQQQSIRAGTLSADEKRKRLEAIDRMMIALARSALRRKPLPMP